MSTPNSNSKYAFGKWTFIIQLSLFSLTHTTYTSLDGEDPVFGVVDGKGVADLPEDGNVDDPRDDRQGPQPVRRDFANCRQHKVDLKEMVEPK